MAAPVMAAPAGAAVRPAALAGPRGGRADDLKLVKGIGPKLEVLCNSLGFYHFDQIANWTAGEVAWVDENLEGFKGRVTRDEWTQQARDLAAGKPPRAGGEN
jgi:predicted flap endonuclease-1-like 5' DNA nuclease